MYKSTNEQDRVCKNFVDRGHEIFGELVAYGLDADAAVVKLPYVNEAGENVQHGANMTMHNLCRTYFESAQAMARYFNGFNRGRDYFPYMVLRYKACGYKMPEWMQNVIDKNNGIIPTTQAEVTALGGSIFTVDKG